MANYDLTYEGSVVQRILDTGKSLEDDGYIFLGAATTSTAPGTPTERVAYIGGPGTYNNFGSTTVVPSGSVGVFKYNGSAWVNDVIAATSDGCVYAGIATPTTNPGTPTSNVFYVAVTAGTYTNFGGLTVTEGINILKYNGSAWSVEQVVGINNEPIDGSNNLVKSGGVQNELALGAVYDVSAKNPTAGPNNDGRFESLSALLSDANLNTLIPTAYRKGGMSIKFIQSSDNKYVQCRLNKNTWSTDVNDWSIIDNYIINVNALNNTSSAYGSKVAAYQAVPTSMRKSGQIITFLLSDGWHIEQFLSSNVVLYWESADSWKPLGYEHFINVNSISNHPSTFSTAGYARLAVPNQFRKTGMVITALIYDVWIVEQFIGTSTTESNWISNDNWVRISPSSLSIVPYETGYRLSYKGSNYDLASQERVEPLAEAIDGINENLLLGIHRQIEITNLTYLGSGYLDGGQIKSGYASIYYCPVTGGTNYIISSELDWYEGYDAVGFSANEPSQIPSGAGQYTKIFASKPPVGKTVYTPAQNGYIILCYRSGKKSHIYTISDIVGTQDILDIIDVSQPLYGKTIAVLGDSIMEFMGGDVPSSNSITLKNYSDPSDTTIYQISDATVINGIIYLSSSLDGGNVTAQSIRLEIVNSEQSYIDSRGWDFIKNKLGAKDIINCGQGGGRFPEMGIVTQYPSTTLEGAYADKLQSFPNQVRMLKRLVSDNIYSTPDCIVIWMGVNGTTQFTQDTLDEAMALDWTVLSDDILGYSYRQKFFGAIRYGIESLYRAFPDALIVFVSPVMTSRGNLKINTDDPAYRGYDDLAQTGKDIQKIASRYSCMFFDALSQIGVANFAYRADTTISGGNEVATGTPLGNLIPRYLGDGLHPNSAGKVVWGNYLCRMLSSFYFDKK